MLNWRESTPHLKKSKPTFGRLTRHFRQNDRKKSPSSAKPSASNYPISVSNKAASKLHSPHSIKRSSKITHHASRITVSIPSNSNSLPTPASRHGPFARLRPQA